MDAWIVIPDRNYPIKEVTKDKPDVKRITELFKSLLDKKFANLDDLTRKQKFYALSTKL
jgi:hypothetical protein